MQKHKNTKGIKHLFKISIAEGTFAQMFTTLSGPGSVFITKLAVMLGATSIHFSLLAAIGQLSQIFQPLGVALTSKKESRKNTTLLFAGIGRGLAFIFGIVAFFINPAYAIWIFLGLFFLSASFQAISANTWIAWISDIVPPRFRGRFFSTRNQFLMIAGVLTGYVLGFVVDLFDKEPSGLAQKVLPYLDSTVFTFDNLPVIWMGLFSFATIIGIVGLIILAMQHEKHKEIDHEPFRQLLLTPLKDKNFRKLLLYGIWWMLAIGIGSPFWQPFMIKKLGMSIVSIQIYGTISTIASLIALKPWGKIIDHFGNKTSMRLAIILGGLNPLLWLFLTKDSYWLIYLEAVLSGTMWAGANVITINFVLSITPGKKYRQIYSGVYSAFTGVGMMITMLLSGIIQPPNMTLFGLNLEPEQFLFLLTGLARWTAEIPLTWVKETKSRPLGEMMFFMRRFNKVRIGRFYLHTFKRPKILKKLTKKPKD